MKLLLLAITIYIFYSPTCDDCKKALDFLGKLKGKGMNIHKYDLSNPQNIGKLLQFYRAYKIPEERWGGTLALFVFNHCLTSLKEIKERLPQILKENGRAPPIPSGKPSLPSLSILAILSAGLLDGIDPCAFSIIALLFSLLAGAERRRILSLGFSYILGSFIAYALLGIGLLQIVKGIYAVSLLSEIFNPLMAFFLLSFFLITLRQPLICKADGYLLPLMNRMRKSSSLLLFFFAGAFVSLVELFCTGQVYFPTLAYIWTESYLRPKALILLLLYLFAFITPLVLIVFLLWWGKKWEVLGERALRWERRFLLLFFLSMFLYFLYRTVEGFL
ncbi:MAG: cytochrome c biogenesis CcdA family protein [bacterium]